MLDASPTALRAFVLVATYRSFSQAARALGTRQSTISSQIARLEEVVGQPLLERSTRRVSLAPAGKRLLPLAEEIVELHTVAAARINDAALTGQIRFSCTESVWTGFAVAEAVGRFSRSHPEVDLTLRLLDESAITAAFAAGEVDLCLVSEQAPTDSARLVRRERLRWYGRAPDAQHGLPVALLDTPYPAALTTIEDLLGGRNGRRFTRALCGASLAAAGQAVLGGIGVAALPVAYADALGAPTYQGDLPALPGFDVFLLAGPQIGEAAAALRNQLMQRLPRNARGAGDLPAPIVSRPRGPQAAEAAKRAR